MKLFFCTFLSLSIYCVSLSRLRLIMLIIIGRLFERRNRLTNSGHRFTFNNTRLVRRVVNNNLGSQAKEKERRRRPITFKSLVTTLLILAGIYNSNNKIYYLSMTRLIETRTFKTMLRELHRDAIPLWNVEAL